MAIYFPVADLANFYAFYTLVGQYATVRLGPSIATFTYLYFPSFYLSVSAQSVALTTAFGSQLQKSQLRPQKLTLV